MMKGRRLEMPASAFVPTTGKPRKLMVGLHRLLIRLFAQEAVNEAVSTRAHFNADPQALWNQVMFYEEVPGRPPFLLRAVLPHPVRTEGDKTRVDSKVRCVYKGGLLVKRITHVNEPHFLQFEVIEQQLAIENYALTVGGSYRISGSGDATDVVLTTNYLAYLRPRYVWRPLERLLVTQLHLHILAGFSTVTLEKDSEMVSASAQFPAEQSTPLGGLACTLPQSSSHR